MADETLLRAFIAASVSQKNKEDVVRLAAECSTLGACYKANAIAYALGIVQCHWNRNTHETRCTWDLCINGMVLMAQFVVSSNEHHAVFDHWCRSYGFISATYITSLEKYMLSLVAMFCTVRICRRDHDQWHRDLAAHLSLGHYLLMTVRADGYYILKLSIYVVSWLSWNLHVMD